MTALKEAKRVGLKVSDVEKLTDRNGKLLNRLYKAHPELYKILMLGCQSVLNKTVIINGVEYVKKGASDEIK